MNFKKSAFSIGLLLFAGLFAFVHFTSAQTVTSNLGLSITVILPQYIPLATSTNPDNSVSATAPTTQASTTSSGIVTTVNISTGTVITGPSSWNGVLTLPQATTTFYTAPTPSSGYTVSVATVVEIGAGDTPLTLSQATKIIFAGQAGNLVGWSQSGIFNAITDICDANNDSTTMNGGSAFPDSGNCKISNDGGGNLVVWTKHFSTFIIYTQTLIPTTPPPNNNVVGTTGGGGGGGGGPFLPPLTSVTFLGRAYPKSEVTILKDGQVAASTVAGNDSQFNTSLSSLSGGSYIFSIYSEDTNGNRSSLVTFPVSVTVGAATQISGIFIAPTIAVDKTQVKQGDNLAIFGQSAPLSSITITIASDNETFGKVLADSNGTYLYNLDTSELDMGDHLARSKATLASLNLLSPQSSAISFTVGTQNVLAPKKKVISKGDINKDGKVNLVDFSVMSYWYRRPKPPANVDLNGDGKVDLIDLSILAHYWTG